MSWDQIEFKILLFLSNKITMWCSYPLVLFVSLHSAMNSNVSSTMSTISSSWYCFWSGTKTPTHATLIPGLVTNRKSTVRVLLWKVLVALCYQKKRWCVFFFFFFLFPVYGSFSAQTPALGKVQKKNISVYLSDCSKCIPLPCSFLTHSTWC